MKRVYINPTVEISMLEGQNLFCASGNEDFGKGPDYGMDAFDLVKPF